MRPSQVTHQGRLYYHCAFTAPAKHPLEMHTYICSRYLYMYACSWVCHQNERSPEDAWCVCYVWRWLWVWLSAVHRVTHSVPSTCAASGLKTKQLQHVFSRVIVTCNLCWFGYRTPNCTPVLLWILYWSPDQVGNDHELHLRSASGGWWEIWNSRARKFCEENHNC